MRWPCGGARTRAIFGWEKAPSANVFSMQFPASSSPITTRDTTSLAQPRCPALRLRPAFPTCTPRNKTAESAKAYPKPVSIWATPLFSTRQRSSGRTSTAGFAAYSEETHMNRIAWRFAAAGLLMAFTAVAQTVPRQERALSKAEYSIVARQIATLKSPGERRMAAGWSDAKKMAEMICRPAALRALQKQNRAVDRVFLGTEDPTTLTLESSARLTGTGEYRTPQGWQNISFICEVNPVTAK